MTEPQGFWGGPRLDSLEAEVRILKQELAQLRNRGGRNSGALSIKAPNGNTTFNSGPTPDTPMPDGTPQWITAIRDTSGLARLTMWDPNPAVDGFVQALYMWDHLSQLLWTSDNNGGWAEPHLPIPMYPRVSPPGAGANCVPGETWDYMWVNAAGAAAEDVIWSGCIGYVSHTRVWIKGTWGGLDGGTGEYKLKINGTTVGTWAVGGLATDTRGPFVIAGPGAPAQIGHREVDIDLTVRRSAGSGRIACQVSHCNQRQT